jgi:hypothetical protein
LTRFSCTTVSSPTHMHQLGPCSEDRKSKGSSECACVPSASISAPNHETPVTPHEYTRCWNTPAEPRPPPFSE